MNFNKNTLSFSIQLNVLFSLLTDSLSIFFHNHDKESADEISVYMC